MDVTTGRIKMFVGGAAREVAHTGELVGSGPVEYVGQVGIDTDLAISPAITNDQSLLIECTAQWQAGSNEKIVLRVRNNGAYDTTGYYYGIWSSDSALATVTNTNGIGVIWRNTDTSDRKFYSHGLLRCFGGSGVRYLGMSAQFVPAGNVNVIRTHAGWRESFGTGSIDGVRFERTVAGTLSSFIARVWRVKTA
jgi:hypothetical protein